eukprot:499605-Rhodomonas_salina.5
MSVLDATNKSIARTGHGATHRSVVRTARGQEIQIPFRNRRGILNHHSTASTLGRAGARL